MNDTIIRGERNRKKLWSIKIIVRSFELVFDLTVDIFQEWTLWLWTWKGLLLKNHQIFFCVMWTKSPFVFWDYRLELILNDHQHGNQFWILYNGCYTCYETYKFNAHDYLSFIVSIKLLHTLQKTRSIMKEPNTKKTIDIFVWEKLQTGIASNF